MSQFLAVIQHGTLGLALSGLLYTGSMTTAALVALVARSRDARNALALLVRRTAGARKADF
jgi:hypothetical protein